PGSGAHGSSRLLTQLPQVQFIYQRLLSARARPAFGAVAPGMPMTYCLSLKEGRLAGSIRRIETEVPVSLRGRHPSARCSLEKPVLHQERLVNFLERSDVFANRGGNGSDTDGTALEL